MSRRSLLSTSSALVATLLLLGQIGARAETPITTNSATADKGMVLPIKVEDTQSFFRDYIRSSKPKKKDDSETEDEYLSRLPVPVDQTTTRYFRVDPGNKKCYTLDVAEGKLTIWIGKHECSLHNSVTQILYDVEASAYEASNAFGATATVGKGVASIYGFALKNCSKWPKDVLNRSSGEIRLSLTLPMVEAGLLSGSFEVIVGVRLLGYKNSRLMCTYARDPTLSDPYNVSVFDWLIDANLVTVVVRDSMTGEVFLERTAGPDR